MNRKNATRNALFTSVLALLLCVSMLVGTTFAWFTDEVVSGMNTIAAGNLDIELEYAKVVGGQVSEWKTVKDATDIFDPNALWEPGHVEVAYLKVSNLGSLDLKYQLGVNVASEVGGVNVEGKEFNLSDHLVFKTVEMPDALTTYSDREAVAAAAGTEKGLKDYNGKTTALQAKGDNKNSEDYVALIVYMPETVGNEANYRGESVPTINLGVSLFATQVEAENDSFDNTYDEDAWHNAMKVTNAQDLQAAINAGETAIQLENDIAAEEPIVIPAGAKVALNLNGKTVSGAGVDADGNKVHALVNNGALKLVGGTVSSAGANGGSAIYNGEGASLTLEDVTVVGAPQDANNTGAWPSYAINNYGNLTIKSADITSAHGAISVYGDTVIYDANVTVNGRGGSSHVFFIGGEGTDLIVHGGTYTHKGNVDGSLAYIMTGTTMTVNGGTFTASNGGYGLATYTGSLTVNGGTFANAFQDWGGPITITGGTFASKPNDKDIATGYKAVENNDMYVVVPQNAEGVIGSAADLYALSNKSVKGTYELVADINMTGYDMQPIMLASGAENELTFHGNGHTISNLNLVAATQNGMSVAGLFNVMYSGKALNVSDLTLTNVTSNSSKYASAVVAYNSTEMPINLDDVDVNGATVSAETVAALVGYTTGAVNLTDCDVSGLSLTGEKDEKIGAFIGTANQATCAVTTDGCTNGTSYREYGRVINGATWNGAEMIATGLGKKDGNYVVYDANGLATLNEMMANKTAGQGYTVNLQADIDFAGKTWTTVDSHVDFGCYLKEFNGNGHTISNLTINGQAMFRRFAGSGDVVIKDITFDNATVNSNGNLNTSILTVQAYQNVLLDNVDVKNSSITGSYKVAPLIATVYNENPGTTVTATLKNCDVSNTTVSGSLDFMVAGMVAFVYETDNDKIVFDNCTVTDVVLSAGSTAYSAMAAVYCNDGNAAGSFDEVAGVTVTNVTKN